MGIFKDLWNARKQMKALEKQTFGTTSSVGMLGELVKEAPGMIQQASATLGQMGADNAQAQQLGQTGVDAQATIVAVRDTGTTIGVGGVESPVAELDLMVHLAGHPDTKATVRTPVPRLSIGRLTPGGTLPVKVDPLDLTKAAVVWS